MPKVSIIIPLFNKEEYISTTLDTVLGQEFSDYEVIIVNDGSTDSSLDIVNEYARQDSRIKVYTIPNGGVSNARNEALNYAKGDWIQFLDADDTLTDDYLKKAIIIAEENKVDILFTDFLKVDAEGMVLEKVEGYHDKLVDHDGMVESFAELQYYNGFFGFISNKLINREFLRNAKVKFPTDITLAEDLTFYVHLYKKLNRAYFMDCISFKYLQMPQNSNKEDKTDYRMQLSIQIKIRDWLDEEGKYDKYCRIIDRRISECIYCIIYYDNERGLGIKQAYHDIEDNPEIFRSLCGQEAIGLQKRVLCLLKERRYKALIVVFKVRNFIRGSYRRMKRNG